MFSKISLRIRLVLLFVFIFGSVSILFNIYTFQFMIDGLQKDFDDALYNYAVDVSDGIELGRNAKLELVPINLNQGKILPFPLGQALIQIRHSSGKVMARLTQFSEVNFPYRKEFEAFGRGEDSVYKTIDLDATLANAEAHSYRLISMPLDNSPQPQLALQIAVPMTLMENQIDSRLNRLRFGIPVVLFLAALGGIFVSGRALAPVKEMTESAQRISILDLSKRVRVPKNNDEIKDLALTFNHMLDRIEGAFKSQERFVADASHQLLTPLSLLRAELELQARDPQNKNMGEFFRHQLQEIDHLSFIVKDMLFLAQVDSGRETLHKSEVMADELLSDILPSLQKSLQRKKIDIKFSLIESDFRQTVAVDPALIKHLLYNVIENAIKYSPEGSQIALEVSWRKDASVVKVSDQGTGIPDEVRENMFDRFRRGRVHDPHVKGYGLGLSIAKKIADLHQADLSFERAVPHGTIAILTIPAGGPEKIGISST